ncbi:MAG: DEAD/DEAH box helicase [Verrucomicrobia bacterium]|nr:DEAD/DEAH box helicase [Verrucomicrobiota bacterium]
MVSLIIPDKWQQDAVSYLREGRDVVLHAPTGAGKTYVFELLYDSLRGQAVYTVPTRALANDKLAEWRARGWDVGISTGDIAANLDARVVVATLETQKTRILQGSGPKLLVVDEYQLMADPVRGVNYELVLAMAPPETQLLLMSGSVDNPHEVTGWLQRIGRNVELVQHLERPVRLDEVMLSDLPVPAPGSMRGYWPRLISRALLSGLGPILIFAPRRRYAEELAQALAATMPPDDPLSLSQDQAMMAGEPLARLLRSRIAFHHSGLSYSVRAGIIEPLAKRGQLRVVVATMGLAAGINFSMRSVVITGTTYQAGNLQLQVRPDELLQMFGRAGRRGLDEAGYALVTPDTPRLHEAHPLKLRRAESIDWPSMLAVMEVAHRQERDPFLQAMELSRRLYSSRRLPLGIEVAYGDRSAVPSPGAPDQVPAPDHHQEDAAADATPFRPCGLLVDGERGRLVHRNEPEMQNSRGEWERQPPLQRGTLADLWVRVAPNRWRPALSIPATLNGRGFGSMCKIRLDERRFEYGREVPVAVAIAAAADDDDDVDENDYWMPVKWLRKTLQRDHPVLAVRKRWTESEFLQHVMPLAGRALDGVMVDWRRHERIILARFGYGHHEAVGHLDSHGRLLQEPLTRRQYPEICVPCAFRAQCETLDLTAMPAFAWRQLGLIDPQGNPTRRGLVFSFFNHGEGLAIAAALEEPDYPIEDIVFDLGNLRAGHRFSMDEPRIGGRLGWVCQQTYQRADFAGYLEMGVPPAYGHGASALIRSVIELGISRHKLLNESIRYGDIERVLTEWRSLLRQITQAPELDWDRWSDLRAAAGRFVTATQSPTLQPLPALLPAQMRRYPSRVALV